MSEMAGRQNKTIWGGKTPEDKVAADDEIEREPSRRAIGDGWGWLLQLGHSGSSLQFVADLKP
jgi:hypothetical protein